MEDVDALCLGVKPGERLRLKGLRTQSLDSSICISLVGNSAAIRINSIRVAVDEFSGSKVKYHLIKESG